MVAIHTTTSWSGEERRAHRTDVARTVVLVIDADVDRAELHASALRADGFTTTAAGSAGAAVEAAPAALVAVITQGSLEISSLELVARLHETRCDLPIIMLAATESPDDVIAALRAGVADFIKLPVNPTFLGLRVRRAADYAAMSRELEVLRGPHLAGESTLRGSSPAVSTLNELVLRVAASDVTVLLHGETGAGKELVAKAIHAKSARRNGPFVALNCAAIPATLLESELFGHTRGAYTDAKTSRDGIFVQATGGTLLLDEIGDMPIEMQAKLLRTLQERRVRPVGGSVEVEFDTRVISATHHDLEELVAKARFRDDLLFRLNVLAIEVPPLRTRGHDVIVLATEMLARAAVRDRRPPVRLSPEVAERLLAYDWPGNVRELENCIERVVALARSDHVAFHDLPERIRSFQSDRPLGLANVQDIVKLEVLEERYIQQVIKLLGGNKSAAADLLGIDRRTLYRRLEKYGVEQPSHSDPAAMATTPHTEQ
jgi:two-component system response regulator HydG